MPVRVLFASVNTEQEKRWAEALQNHPDIEWLGAATSEREVLVLLESLPVDVVLIAQDLSDVEALTLTERLSTRFPDVGLILLSPNADPQVLRRAIRAGASDYLIEPVSLEELVSSILDVHRRRENLRRHVLLEGKEAEEPPPSQIIAVYSPRGGVGKSLLTANLGVGLRLETRHPTVLVDLNLEFGDLDLLLNVTPRRTLASLVPRAHRLDADSLESFLTEHPDTGLKVLAAPTRPEYADTVTVAIVEHVLQLTTLDLLALRNTKLALEMMEKLHLREKVKVVLNRADSDVGITAREVEDILQCPLYAKIPSDGRVAVPSVNEGVPFMLSQPHSKIAQAVRDLVRRLIGREVSCPEDSPSAKSLPSPRRRGWLEILFGAPR
jgi:pilus assembly protein CpaE